MENLTRLAHELYAHQWLFHMHPGFILYAAPDFQNIWVIQKEVLPLIIT
jgi:hypothetical protein